MKSISELTMNGNCLGFFCSVGCYITVLFDESIDIIRPRLWKHYGSHY